MLITTESVRLYAGENISHRNYREGNRLHRSNFIISCGKNEQRSRPGIVYFTAYCLSVSHLKEKPYEITGEFTEAGEILFCLCSCPAGLGQMCKHVISILIYLEKRKEPLEPLSCTDKKCSWKRTFQNALENFVPAPLLSHPCYANKKKIILERKKYKKQYIVEISKEQSEHLLSSICHTLPNSASAMDRSRRHEIQTINQEKKVSDDERAALQSIFENQESDLMKKIQDLLVQVPQECCKLILQNLETNAIDLCEKSMNYFDFWLKERTKRITGLTCYKVYTYTKNKTPNWQTKSKEIFSPKKFKTEATEYGKKTEKEARDVFINKTKKSVILGGLIISKQNPWLGYSPDGVIFENGKPIAVLEIKCPIIGKTNGINRTVEKCLTTFLIQTKGQENISLRQKHPYYGQV